MPNLRLRAESERRVRDGRHLDRMDRAAPTRSEQQAQMRRLAQAPGDAQRASVAHSALGLFAAASLLNAASLASATATAPWQRMRTRRAAQAEAPTELGPSAPAVARSNAYARSFDTPCASAAASLQPTVRRPSQRPRDRAGGGTRGEGGQGPGAQASLARRERSLPPGEAEGGHAGGAEGLAAWLAHRRDAAAPADASAPALLDGLFDFLQTADAAARAALARQLASEPTWVVADESGVQQVIDRRVWSLLYGEPRGAQREILDEIRIARSVRHQSSRRHLASLRRLITARLNRLPSYPGGLAGLLPATRAALFNGPVRRLMPALAWHAGDPAVDRLDVTSLDFAFLHAGLALFGQAGGVPEDMSLEDLIGVGQSVERMIRDDASLVELGILFRWPALLRYLDANPEVTLDALLEDLPTQQAALEAFFHDSDALARRARELDPFWRLEQALASFRTRGELAAEILDAQCPLAAGAADAGRIADYKNGLRACDDVALPELAERFVAQNAEIGARYAAVDAMLLEQALQRDLDQAERSFLAHAQIGLGDACFSVRGALQRQGVNLRLFAHIPEVLERRLRPGVEVLVAAQGQTVRRYLLERDARGTRLTRADAAPEIYLARLAVPAPIDPEERLHLSPAHLSLKAAHAPLEHCTQALVRRHREALELGLYEHGFEPTTLERLTQALKSLIPFHDCVTGVARHDASSVPACGLDALSLMPVIGAAASLGLRAGVIGARGSAMAARAALRTALVTRSLGQTLRIGLRHLGEQALVPAAEALDRASLAQLAVQAARAVDIGFEPAYLGGRSAWRALRHGMSDAAQQLPCLRRLATMLAHGAAADELARDSAMLVLGPSRAVPRVAAARGVDAARTLLQRCGAGRVRRAPTGAACDASDEEAGALRVMRHMMGDADDAAGAIVLGEIPAAHLLMARRPSLLLNCASALYGPDAYPDIRALCLDPPPFEGLDEASNVFMDRIRELALLERLDVASRDRLLSVPQQRWSSFVFHPEVAPHRVRDTPMLACRESYERTLRVMEDNAFSTTAELGLPAIPLAQDRRLAATITAWVDPDNRFLIATDQTYELGSRHWRVDETPAFNLELDVTTANGAHASPPVLPPEFAFAQDRGLTHVEPASRALDAVRAPRIAVRSGLEGWEINQRSVPLFLARISPDMRYLALGGVRGHSNPMQYSVERFDLAVAAGAHAPAARQWLPFYPSRLEISSRGDVLLGHRNGPNAQLRVWRTRGDMVHINGVIDGDSVGFSPDGRFLVYSEFPLDDAPLTTVLHDLDHGSRRTLVRQAPLRRGATRRARLQGVALAPLDAMATLSYDDGVVELYALWHAEPPARYLGRLHVAGPDAAAWAPRRDRARAPAPLLRFAGGFDRIDSLGAQARSDRLATFAYRRHYLARMPSEADRASEQGMRGRGAAARPVLRWTPMI